jgi:translocation protein SEC72
MEVWKRQQMQDQYGNCDLGGCDLVGSHLAPFRAIFANVASCSLLFVATAWMSFRNVMHFRRTGTLPDAVSDPTFAAQSKAAFNPAHDFEEEEDDFRSGRAGMGASVRNDQDEDYALLHQSEIDDLGNGNGRSAMHGAYDPTATGSGSVLHDYNTSYGGAHGQHYAQPSEFGSTVSGYGR